MKITTEFVRLAVVALVPAALLASFPYEAIGFKAARSAGSAQKSASCAFAEISPERAQAAVESARTSWTAEVVGMKHARLELLDVDMLGLVHEELAPFEPVRRTLGPAKFNPSILPPSVGAPELEQLPGVPDDAVAPPFSREELLKIPTGQQ